MSVLSISLPKTIIKRVDSETRDKGFSTRSEFIRAILRQYFSGGLKLEAFGVRPLEEIKLELARTGKYNQKFIESVVKGLEKSSVYGGKTPKK